MKEVIVETTAGRVCGVEEPEALISKAFLMGRRPEADAVFYPRNPFNPGSGSAMPVILAPFAPNWGL